MCLQFDFIMCWNICYIFNKKKLFKSNSTLISNKYQYRVSKNQHFFKFFKTFHVLKCSESLFIYKESKWLSIVWLLNNSIISKILVFIMSLRIWRINVMNIIYSPFVKIIFQHILREFPKFYILKLYK
jgi:hypothetical protein